MKLVKKVMDSIANPLTYIFNLSFTTGTFPQKIKKLPKLFHYIKLGTNNISPVMGYITTLPVL